MKDQNLNKPTLKLLEMLELVGITFIRGYIQFLFDGPLLNMYTLPHIMIDTKIFTPTDNGFYDTLCALINKKILLADVNEKEEMIVIKFEGGVELLVSLKSEDRNCAEAAMLQLETGGEWNVW